MKRILSLFLFLSFSAGAADITFECNNKEKQTLQLTVNEDHLLASMDAPDYADVSFILDGKNFEWKQNQYLSFPLAGNTVTLFRLDAINSVYVEYSQASGNAFVGISIERNDYSFDCQRR